jgi:hypothetical protein
MASVLAVVVVALTILLNEDIGRSKKKASLRSIFSKSAAINKLSFARFFLFGSRDIWFVVAVPVFFSTELGWSHQKVGGFLATWVIGYGIVQSFAPRVIRTYQPQSVSEVAASRLWALLLGIVTAALAVASAFDDLRTPAIVIGLIIFGVIFAVNSSIHSYLILAYSDDDRVAMDVGFYYSSNAAGRFVGTLLSGVLYVWGGLTLALWGSTVFVLITWISSFALPEFKRKESMPIS